MKANTSLTNHTVLVLRGLGVKDPLHTDMSHLLQSCGLQVQGIMRKEDGILFVDPMSMIERYVTQIGDEVTKLLDQGREVHLFGVSFGGLLTLEAVRHCTQIQSLVLIAPILYPRDAFANNIPTGITTDMEQDICTDLSKWTPPKLTLPTIAVFGGGDTIAPLKSWETLRGADIFIRELPTIVHGQISADLRTHETIVDFYRRILPQEANHGN